MALLRGWRFVEARFWRIKEQGYDLEATAWFAVAMAAATPRDIVAKVSADVNWAGPKPGNWESVLPTPITEPSVR